MTVLENLLVAQHHSLNLNIISGVIQTSDYKKKENAAIEKAYQILDMLRLADDANKISSSLPKNYPLFYKKVFKAVKEKKLVCGDINRLKFIFESKFF